MLDKSWVASDLQVSVWMCLHQCYAVLQLVASKLAFVADTRGRNELQQGISIRKLQSKTKLRGAGFGLESKRERQVPCPREVL